VEGWGGRYGDGTRPIRGRGNQRKMFGDEAWGGGKRRWGYDHKKGKSQNIRKRWGEKPAGKEKGTGVGWDLL